MGLRELEAGLEIALVGADRRGQRVGAARRAGLPLRRNPVAECIELRIGGRLAQHRFEGGFGLCQRAAFEQQLDVVAARVVVGRVDRHRLLQPRQRGGRVALFEQRLGLVEFGLGLEFVRARHMLVEEGADLALGQCADKAVDRLALVEQHAKRDRAHAEGLAQLGGDLRLLVAVELGQLEAPGVRDLELFEQRAERLAGPAPGRPDVEQQRLLHRGLDQFGFKVLDRDVEHGGLEVRACRLQFKR